MIEVVVTNAAKRHAKLQSNHHHQQTNSQLFTGQMTFLSPNHQCQSSEGHLFMLTMCMYNVHYHYFCDAHKRVHIKPFFSIKNRILYTSTVPLPTTDCKELQ